MGQTQDAGIPIDVQWNDIDYMQDHLDFTYSKSKYAGLPEFVDYLHKNGLHYIPIIDPAISSSEKLGTYKPYEIGLEMNVFIQNISGDPFEGRVGQTENVYGLISQILKVLNIGP